MNYQIMENRLASVLQRNRDMDPQHICEVLKGELSPIIRSFIDLEGDIKVRYREEDKRMHFWVEMEALRFRPCGYLPKR